MVNIADLKNYILEEQQIEPILEELGCHHISHKTGYYQCANPDGDNRTALCIYENENLTAVDYTRDIANGKTSYDLISVVQFFWNCLSQKPSSKSANGLDLTTITTSRKTFLKVC